MKREILVHLDKLFLSGKSRKLNDWYTDDEIVYELTLWVCVFLSRTDILYLFCDFNYVIELTLFDQSCYV